METKFQTSFIPKKPTTPSMGVGSMGLQAPQTHHGVASLYMSIAVLIFIVSLGALGGSYLYKSYLLNLQKDYSSQLQVREKEFKTSTVAELKRQNIRINTSKQLLKEHLAMSKIFDYIGSLTIEKVRFLSLDITAPQNATDDVKINMSGYGTNYFAVAWQSDVLGQLKVYDLRDIVKNPILSNPSEDPDAIVSFGFSASIDPKALSYENSLTTEDPATAPSDTSLDTNAGNSDLDTNI